MALTLVTNPVGSASSKIFAGLQPIEYIFKREDLAITGVTSGAGGITVTVATNITSVLTQGDSIYVYSEGTGYTYDGVGTILSISATEIVVDLTFFVTGTGGFINYKKNYYVEMMLVNKNLTDANILPFTLQNDGNAAGNISIDVSIANDLNRQRGIIAKTAISESRTEFEIKYRECYIGISNTYTLIDNSLVIVVHAPECPEIEEILNNFDTPRIYLGYPAGLVVAHKGGTVGSTIEVNYIEKNRNLEGVAVGSLGTLDSGENGFLMWAWAANTVVQQSTRFVDFNFTFTATYDFLTGDFSDTDFVTG